MSGIVVKKIGKQSRPEAIDRLAGKAEAVRSDLVRGGNLLGAGKGQGAQAREHEQVLGNIDPADQIRSANLPPAEQRREVAADQGPEPDHHLHLGVAVAVVFAYDQPPDPAAQDNVCNGKQGEGTASQNGQRRRQDPPNRIHEFYVAQLDGHYRRISRLGVSPGT